MTASSHPIVRVHVTGADGDLGSRVLAGLDAEPGLDVVVMPADVSVSAAGNGRPDRPRVDVVVHLGSADHDARARRRENVTEGVDRTLADATTLDATHLVLVSSAMVYGAWPNNPVPLTEEAILRPDVEFVYARQLAAAEALAERWRRQRAPRAVAVLRPVVAMAASGTSGLAAALAAGLGQRFGEDDPPAQFLHLDDLAAAVVVAVRERLDGVFNVAPDGWIAGERVRALTGQPPRVQWPDAIGEVLARWRWRFQRGPIPPGLRSYTRAPWVVANDRLKSHGWAPTVTNEQAYVEGTEGSWWTTITPKRRQELSLGAMVIAGLGGLIATLVAVRRWRRRRTVGGR